MLSSAHFVLFLGGVDNVDIYFSSQLEDVDNAIYLCTLLSLALSLSLSLSQKRKDDTWKSLEPHCCHRLRLCGGLGHGRWEDSSKAPIFEWYTWQKGLLPTKYPSMWTILIFFFFAMLIFFPCSCHNCWWMSRCHEPYACTGLGRNCLILQYFCIG